MKSMSAAPFGQSVPRFTGWSGSPSMWKTLARAFLARSPRLYIRMPQETAQYGQVLRVSVARLNLNSRTSASAAVGEKPSRTRLEPAKDALVTFKNSRRVTSAMTIPLRHVCRPLELYSCARRGARAARLDPRAGGNRRLLGRFVTL